jgi:hypothetical protein
VKVELADEWLLPIVDGIAVINNSQEANPVSLMLANHAKVNNEVEDEQAEVVKELVGEHLDFRLCLAAGVTYSGYL